MPALSVTEPAAFTTWRSRVVELAKANRWDKDEDSRKRAVAFIKAALDGDMGIQASHLSSGDYNSYLQFLNNVQATVMTPAGEEMGVNQFHRLYQAQGEPIVKWGARLRTHSILAFPGADWERTVN